MDSYKDKDFQQTIIDAINNNSLVLFVGAGVSRLCGLPSWDSLSNTLLDYCVSIPNCNFNYYSKDRIISTIDDPREKISIAYHVLSKNNAGEILFFEKLKELLSISKAEEKNNNNIKRIISSIRNLSRIIISTNADTILDDSFSPNVFYEKEDIKNLKILINSRQIWHIHGSIKNYDSLVFTTDQYLQRYAIKGFKNGLISLFRNQTVLFIGYGFRELQLLDFIVAQETDKENSRLYALQGYFKSDECVFDAEKKYYSDYGIHLIGFEKDDNGYNQLLNVLDELCNSAKLYSKGQSMSLINCRNCIEKKRTEKLSNLVESELNQLSLLEKKNLFSNLIKSKKINSWFSWLYKQPRFSDFVGISNVTSCFNEKERLIKNIEFPFADILFSNYKLLKSKSVFSIVRDLMIQICNTFNDHVCLFSDNFMVGLITRTIFGESRFTKLESSIQFLKNMLELCPDASLWMYNSSIDDSQFCNLPKPLLIEFSKNAIEHRLKNKGLDDYDFDVFYEKNGSEISKKVPKELFTIIISSLLQKQKKETYWYFDLSRDTFATIVENKEGRLENEPENCIIRFLVKCIENMPFAYVLRFVKSNISSNNTFLCALSIYICNLYFSKLKTLFLKHKDLLNNRDYFSEIYSLLKGHCMELSDKELELVFSEIDNMAFSGEYSKIYMAAYKLDLYKLLYDSGIVAAQKYILKINSSFTKEELVSISQFPSPENKSKKVWISSSWASSGNEIEKKISQFNNENYLGFVKSTKDDDDDAKSAISTTLKAEIEKLKLLPLFEANNFEMFYELPNYYKLYLITFFTETSNNYPLEKLATICLNVKKRLDGNFFCEFYNSFCRGLYFRLTSSKEKLKSETIELLSNFIIENLPEDSNYWHPQNNNLDSSAFNALLSADSFYSLNALIILCETNSWLKVKSILVSFIDDSNKKYIAKASVVANTNKIFLFDKDWISNNIQKLFDNEYKGFNLSYSAFNFSLCSIKEFIGILNDNGLLIPLASSCELKDNSWAFICNILFSFISNNIDKEIIDKIIVQENAESAFSRLIDVCLKNTSHWSKAIEEKVNYIIDKAVFLNHKGSLEMLASKLLNLTKILTNRNIAIAKACVFLSQGSNSYYAKDIGNCLSLTTLSNDEKIKILSSFVNGLKEGIHYVNDIVSLFSSINWATKDNQKNELVNKLKLLDPEFEVILQR